MSSDQLFRQIHSAEIRWAKNRFPNPNPHTGLTRQLFTTNLMPSRPDYNPTTAPRGGRPPFVVLSGPCVSLQDLIDSGDFTPGKL